MEEQKNEDSTQKEEQKNVVKEEPGRKCFIITPIGDAASETFRMAKGVIESVIKPLLSEYGYDDIKPSYEINQIGMITTQIINRIIDDDLVIANLTGNNPNVMYELCLRHVTSKPIIHICQNGTNLPFDIKDNRTIFYENDMMGVQELKEQMELFIQEIDYSKDYIDNPIYSAQRMGRLLKEVPKGNEKKIEIELLQNILDQVNNFNLPQNSNIKYKQKEDTKQINSVRVYVNGNELISKRASTKIIENFLKIKLIEIGLIRNLWCDDGLNKTGYITFSNPENVPIGRIRIALMEVEKEFNIELKYKVVKE